MTNGKVHAKGIDARVRQIIKDEGHHILAILKNVEYADKSSIPYIYGEIDILKLYNYGKVGIEEVKTSERGLNKAMEQLTRAKQVFKFYDPHMIAYIINGNKVINYGF